MGRLSFHHGGVEGAVVKVDDPLIPDAGRMVIGWPQPGRLHARECCPSPSSDAPPIGSRMRRPRPMPGMCHSKEDEAPVGHPGTPMTSILTSCDGTLVVGRMSHSCLMLFMLNSYWASRPVPSLRAAASEVVSIGPSPAPACRACRRVARPWGRPHESECHPSPSPGHMRASAAPPQPKAPRFGDEGSSA